MRRYSLLNEIRKVKRKKKRGYKSITSSTLSTFNKPWLDLAGVNEGNTYGNTEIENQGAGKYSPFSFSFFKYIQFTGRRQNTHCETSASRDEQEMTCSPSWRHRGPHSHAALWQTEWGFFFFFFFLTFFLFYKSDKQSKPFFKGVWR